MYGKFLLFISLLVIAIVHFNLKVDKIVASLFHKGDEDYLVQEPTEPINEIKEVPDYIQPTPFDYDKKNKVILLKHNLN